MPTLDARFTINGLIDTARPVFENMESITNSCATWLSYDNLTGQWSVVINQPTGVTASFDDDNIVGPITLTTTSLDGYYNECEVRFHNTELRDQEDYVLLTIPQNQRLPNEPVNRMIINAAMVNNQIQAQLLGLIELKQSRLDKIIQFNTDFSYLNLDAGAVIEVTNSVYGWTNQKFRVLQTSEAEQDGALVVSITAQIYDDAIYDDSDLYLYYREKQTGLINLDPLVDVSPITPSTPLVDSNGNSISTLLALPALLSFLDTQVDDGLGATEVTVATRSYANSIGNLNNMTANYTTNAGYDIDQVDTYAFRESYVLNESRNLLTITVTTPFVFFEYEFLDPVSNTIITANNFAAQPPLRIEVIRGPNADEIIGAATVDWQLNSATFQFAYPSANTYTVWGGAVQTYILNQDWVRGDGNTGIEPQAVYPINFSAIDANVDLNGYTVSWVLS